MDNSAKDHSGLKHQLGLKKKTVKVSWIRLANQLPAKIILKWQKAFTLISSSLRCNCFLKAYNRLYKGGVEKESYPAKSRRSANVKIAIGGKGCCYILYTESELKKDRLWNEAFNTIDRPNHLPQKQPKAKTAMKKINFPKKTPGEELSEAVLQLANMIKTERPLYEQLRKYEVNPFILDKEVLSVLVFFKNFDDVLKKTLAEPFLQDYNENLKTYYDTSKGPFKNTENVMAAAKEGKEVELSCGHSLTTSKACSQAKELKEKMQRGPLQFKCMEKDCFCLLNDTELISLLSKRYEEFTQGYNESGALKGLKPKEKCMICGQFEGVKVYVLHINHTVCQYCLGRYVDFNKECLTAITTDCGPTLTPIRCPARGCSFEVNDRLLRQFLSESMYKNVLRSKGIHSVENLVDNNKKLMECIFGCGSIPNDQIVALGCGHYCCKKCLIHYVNSVHSNRGSIKRIVCPKDHDESVLGLSRKYKRYKIPMPILDKHIDSEIIAKVKQNTTKNIAYCSTKDCKGIYYLDKEFKGKDFVCKTCQKKTCRLCREPAHQGFCKIRKQHMRNAEKNGYIVRSCPNCMEMLAKDRKCSHTTCYVCGTNFCFGCSALRQPILEHNCSFHRKHCPFYVFYENYDLHQSRNCPKCTEKNGICSPPADLDEGDIPLAEIPKDYLLQKFIHDWQLLSYCMSRINYKKCNLQIDFLFRYLLITFAFKFKERFKEQERSE
eukprot:TRINITY_DN120553_c0_g1_i1.p1 TRINITY_DN120553_c0_g1~~TRINITY_DN120553_c0_g1_i1.p1  ORF type:complete len:721 (+),score=23.96 TRINITY_DN120553_c0_g1_i1:1756-3918(+)